MSRCAHGTVLGVLVVAEHVEVTVAREEDACVCRAHQRDVEDGLISKQPPE
ncbi:hypothetical protein [Halarchaeum sp. P4]|uniref:hypothetical protein n=1 Tax=Halarchaeum sp. P4 TaxID=3421639 RepID=UPI003EB8520B